MTHGGEHGRHRARSPLSARRGTSARRSLLRIGGLRPCAGLRRARTLGGLGLGRIVLSRLFHLVMALLLAYVGPALQDGCRSAAVAVGPAFVRLAWAGVVKPASARHGVDFAGIAALPGTKGKRAGRDDGRPPRRRVGSPQAQTAEVCQDVGGAHPVFRDRVDGLFRPRRSVCALRAC